MRIDELQNAKKALNILDKTFCSKYQDDCTECPLSDWNGGISYCPHENLYDIIKKNEARRPQDQQTLTREY